MDEQQFSQLFKHTLDEEIDTVDLWNKVEAKLPASTYPVVRTGFRLSRVALVVVLLAMSAVAVYALYQGTIVPSDPGITDIAQADLLTEIDEIQTIPGDHDLTVTLDYAYADANRITVGYTVRGAAPEGRRMMAYSNPTLLTADGSAFDRLLLLADAQAQQPATDEAAGGFSSTLTANFITGEVAAGDEAALDLRLMVEVALSYLDSGEFPAPGMLMAGATQFEFSVPLIDGVMIDVGQSSTAAERAVELQRISLTPSMTRLDLCYDLPPVTDFPGWAPFVTLSIDGEPVFSGLTESYGSDEPNDLNSPCRSLIIPLALQQHSGEWAIEIVAFHDMNDPTIVISGPWRFAVTMPQS